MAKRIRTDYKEFIAAMETDDDLNQTFSSDVDYPDDMPLIEEIEDDDEQSLEEVEFSFDEDEEPASSLESLDLSMGQIEEEEQEEYTEGEIESLLSRIDLANSDNNKLSFDDLMPKKKKKTGIGVQRKEKKVHHLLVIRDLVVMHPSVCKLQHCKFDAAKAIGYKKRGWPDVPASKHKLVMRVLEEHVQTQHQHVDDTFMDLADVPQAWLTPS
jgi:hypothetical protein